MVVPAVDEEAAPDEEADAHATAERAHTRRAHVERRKQVDAPDGLVGRHAPDLLGGVGHHLEAGEHPLLLAPRLVRRAARHRLLAEDQPPAGRLVVTGERLAVGRVPAALLGVEVAALELADVEERGRAGRAGDDHEAVVAAPLEHLAGGHGVAELEELLRVVDDALASGRDLLGADEVVAEDLAGDGVVGRLGRVADDDLPQGGRELVATLVEELGGLVGQLSLVVDGPDDVHELAALRIVGRDQ